MENVDFRPSVFASARRIRTHIEWNVDTRSEEHTSELQSRQYLACRLLLEKQKRTIPRRVDTPEQMGLSRAPRARPARAVGGPEILPSAVRPLLHVGCRDVLSPPPARLRTL